MGLGEDDASSIKDGCRILERFPRADIARRPNPMLGSSCHSVRPVSDQNMETLVELNNEKLKGGPDNCIVGK